MDEPSVERKAVASGDTILVERRPVPDPTELTQTAIDRAGASLSMLMDEKIAGAIRCTQAKIEGHWELDKSRFENIDARIIDAIQKRNEIDAERFGAINLRFNERDLRFTQQSADHQASITSALNAANSTIARLETTFGKQIEALGARLDAQAVAQAERITDLKDRISGVEGERKGNVTSTTLIIGVVGSMLVLAGLVVTHIFNNIPNGISIH
jgi:hypothetical protein